MEALQIKQRTGRLWFSEGVSWETGKTWLPTVDEQLF